MYTRIAMGLSALSIVLFFSVPIVDLITALVSIVLGIIALIKIGNGQEKDGKSGAIVAIIVGALILIITFGYLLLKAI